MDINVQSVHFSADAKLLAYIDRKLGRLNRLFDRIENIEVFLKLQDTGARVQEKIVEIRVHVPGGWLVDKKTGRTFETAINASIDTLKRQLSRHKGKLHDRHQRSASIEQ